jgi:argininosuccinate lyase
VPLAELALADFQAADPELDERVYDVLGARNAIDAFRSYGSTAPTEVDRQIARWKKVISDQ